MECISLNTPNEGIYMRLLNITARKLRFICVLICLNLLNGCGGSGGQSPILGTSVVSTPPQVILTVPANTNPIVTGVANNMAISAKFNRNMNSATLNTSTFLINCPSGTPITGTVKYNNLNQTATFQQTSSLPVNSICTATITTGVADTNGIQMASEYIWSFNTSNITTIGPTITATNPLISPLQTGICLSQPVSVTFSKSMDALTITSSSFYINSPTFAGSISYNDLTNTATFTPLAYTASTVYSVNLTNGIKDTDGNALLATSFTFQTGTLACNHAAVVDLHSIASYGAFGGNAGVTNSGINTIINGDLGTTAACTLFTGFHQGSTIYTETTLNIGNVTGHIYCGPPAPGTDATLALATTATNDAIAAYHTLSILPIGHVINGELGLITLAPAVYSTGSSFIISAGNLTLDAGGNPDAEWIFIIPSTLTVGTFKQVILSNGAQAKNVYWQVGSAATIGYGSNMVGTIIASSGVTFSTVGQTNQTTLIGRAIGLYASVTMTNTTIVSP